MNWTRGPVIGHGSTATVSLAYVLKSGEVFAVKSSEYSKSEFIQREAEILSSLKSSRVVGYQGIDITREHRNTRRLPFFNLLMDYAPNGTISDAIRRSGGSLQEKAIMNYTRHILEGLEYIHSLGIVHCDIKGSNILVGENGEAKIADFGCAKRLYPDSAHVSTGTPAFMAPEVARGEQQGFSSDVWAVGCTVIEMVTGRVPWSNETDPLSVLYRVGYSGDSPEMPCALSEQCKDFLGKCLSKDPRERWTAKQLLGHQFVSAQNSDKKSKPIEQEYDTSISPRSVIDQRFWNSKQSDLSGKSNNLENEDRLNGDNNRLKEKIKQLCSVFGVPNWDLNCQNWITIRELNDDKSKRLKI